MIGPYVPLIDEAFRLPDIHSFMLTTRPSLPICVNSLNFVVRPTNKWHIGRKPGPVGSFEWSEKSAHT